MSEEAEHRIVAEYLDAIRVCWFHAPNGGARDAVTGARMKRLGVKRGVPDFMLLDSPPRLPGRHSTAFELKTARGRVSPEQRAWLEALAARGWHCFVARGANDAICALRALGYGG